jgi:hypothetical protein
MMHRLVVLGLGLLFGLGCAEGQKPTPLKRSELTAPRSAQHEAEAPKEKTPPGGEEQPKP